MLLSHAMQREETGFPPYNIEKSGDVYRIVVAVAGFERNDIEIVAEQNHLTVRGRVGGNEDNTYLHRGIASRAFERNFDLADFVEVTGATMADGLLTIDLRRELPDQFKPRKVQINTSSRARSSSPQEIEKSAA